MAESFDCIVLGAGGFGSALLCHLALRGVKALGIDRFGVAHDRGSSHGETRIIRKAYFEHPDYVPLLHRAYLLWAQLEAETGMKLFHQVGLLEVGPPEGEIIAGVRLAAKTHGLAVEDVPPAEAARRFPGFHFAADQSAVFEPDAGYLKVEDCVRAHAVRAEALGARLLINEPVVEWKSDGKSVTVRTEKETYHAARLVITAGAWAAQVLADLGLPLKVLRKVLFWCPTARPDYDEGKGGCGFFYDLPASPSPLPLSREGRGETLAGFFYGFPSIDGGRTVKLAEHSGGEVVTDPLTVDRERHPEDFARVAEFIRRWMPGLRPEVSRHAVCLYTMTPDQHFIVDRHPHYPNVVLGAGFSGHGFKFTSVIGEALAELALDGRTRHPIGFLRIDRPGLQSRHHAPRDESSRGA